MKILIRSLCALAAFVTVSVAEGQATPPASTAPVTVSEAGSEYLNPGDEIRIVVWRQPEFSGDFTIGANGTIIHPLYREVQVTGVPLSVVEDRLRTYLTKYQTNPQFVIQPLVKIIVAGEVKSPNLYSVPPQITIAQAIAQAGGATDNGNLADVRVIRDRQTIKMDVTRPDSDASLLEIRSNDQILVGRKRPSWLVIISPVTSTIAATAAIITLFRRY
jgi:polysaccharide biosynthesis/export protein